MSDSSSVLSQALAKPPDDAQRVAAVDPRKSFIVQAPAGSGKTTLLVQRYLTLLATVNEPEEILAITFTRKAAQEMRARVIAELKKTDTSEPAHAAMQRSAERNWNLASSPQRLRIQTIDGFQRGLVQQLPYQSRLSLDYDTIERVKSLYEEAVANTFERIASRNARFGDEIAAMLAAFDNRIDEASALLTTMLTKREQWIEHIPAVAVGALREIDASSLIQHLEQARAAICNERKDELIKALRQQDGLWERCFALVAETKPDSYFNMKDPSDWNHLATLFLTGKDEFRKQITKREGIPPDAAELKRRWKSTVEDLRTTINPLPIAKVRSLPPKRISMTHREDLTNYALTLLACVQELNALFHAYRVVDFTETAIAAHRALQVDDAPTQLALALDYRIRHILVDEYQDTSIAQNEFLNLLMDGWEPDDGNTFFAVGDPMQSIYTFRDADLTNFLTADTGGIRNRRIEKLQLTANFRSSAHLVQWCNKVFAPILGRVNDANSGRVAFAKSVETEKLNEASTHGLHLFQSDDKTLEANHVANKVLELRDKFPFENIAILFRTRSDLGAYFSEFRRLGVKWRSVEMEMLSEFPVVRDLYSLSCALNNPDDRQAWIEVLMCPLAGVELTDIEILAKCERGIDMILLHDDAQLSVVARTILNRIRGPLISGMNSQYRSLRSRVERTWYLLGGANAYQTRQDTKSDETNKANAQHYLDILEQFDNDVIDKDQIWKRLEDMRATETDEAADVEIMTVHTAKGLEFDHVLLPSLSQGTPPNRSPLLYARFTPHGIVMSVKNTTEKDLMHEILFKEESDRLKNETSRQLYVAATRAKNTLWLYGTVKDTHKKMPDRTYLKLLRDVSSGDDWWYFSEEETPRQDTTSARVWRRLDPGFQFVAPASLPNIEANTLTDALPNSVSFSRIDAGLSEPLAIGQLVHAELQRMVEKDSVNLPDEHRVALWRNQLRAQGFNARQVAAILETVQDQLARTVRSDWGRWLLNSTYAGSAAEIAFTTNNGTSSRVSVIDRAFIDQGVRWIVDYKTSMIPDDRDLPLHQKALEYQAQLLRYADIFERLDDLPIKAAIFFTDVAELIEVDVSPTARLALENANDVQSAIWQEDRTFKPREQYG